MTRNTVIIAGAELIHAGMAAALRDVVDRTDTGVFNSWAAKGLFPWDHPAHLGTIGLQADDIALCELSTFDDVVLCGVSNDELARAALTAAHVQWRDVAPSELAAHTFPVRATPTQRPALFDAIAAVCSPMYADDALPASPARAAADMSRELPTGGVVCGDADRCGFWLGRTFPTRQLGSVVLPTKVTPGFAATQAAMARRSGRFAVAIVDGLDTATQSVMSHVNELVIEVWSDDGPRRSSHERLEQLRAAHERGGVQVVELGVRFTDIAFLIAVAGAPRWHS